MKVLPSVEFNQQKVTRCKILDVCRLLIFIWEALGNSRVIPDLKQDGK